MRVKKHVPYLFVLPAFLLVVCVLYYPVIQNVYTSMLRTSAFSSNPAFIGLSNYKEMFKDVEVRTALQNNIRYAVTCIIFQCGGGLFLAILMESKYVRKFSGFFRTAYYIPSVISMTAACLLWKFIYQSRGGMINAILDFLQLASLKHAWLGEACTAIWAIIAMAQWQFMGYYCMLLCVAIQKVPDELYEAAEIDGANEFQKAIRVTIPSIKEMIVVVTLIDIIGCLKVFTEVYTMTLGGPGYSSHVMGTLLYQNAFIYNRMGYASAMGTVMFILMMVISILQLRVTGSGDQ